MRDYTQIEKRGYEIQSLIGTGGFGEVYVAYQPSIKRRVAIKMILPQHMDDPQFIADFEREANLIAQLEHPNIVPLYDFWQDKNRAFLVMRYIEHGSVYDLLRRRGVLTVQEASSFIQQIAGALHVAHEANIVHRDLKPANILVDERGNAYLTDFGIAKQLSTKHGTIDDHVRGTMSYMPPEHLTDSVISPHGDIYALGILLYEMLAGKHPFPTYPIAHLVQQKLLGDIPSLEHTVINGREIDRLIQHATAIQPHDRYTDARLFAAELAQVVDNMIATTTHTQLRVPEPATPPRPLQPSDTMPLVDISVMIIDDHYVVRRGLMSFLNSSSGIQVVAEADSGEEALTLCETVQPDVVLLDVKLPGMDGIETCRRIHQLIPSAHILMLSSSNDSQTVQAALDAGATDFLQKDALPQHIVDTIMESYIDSTVSV